MATYKSIAYDQVLGNPSAMVLLQTSSVTDGDGDLTFTGLSSDYKEYMITHLNYKSQNDGEGLAIQGTTDGTNYNIAMTTTHFSAGYFNTTSAITAIQFQPSTGDMEAGTFKLYGVN